MSQFFGTPDFSCPILDTRKDKDYYDKNNYQGDEYNYDQGGTWVLIIIKTWSDMCDFISFLLRRYKSISVKSVTLYFWLMFFAFFGVQGYKVL